MKYIRLLATLLLIVSLSACQSSPEKKQSDEDKSKRAAFHYRLGIDALHKGFLPKAFEELMLADSIAPKQAETLDAIAYAWRVRGDNKEAKKYYKQAIKAGGSSATRNNYGSLLVELGEYKEAAEHLNIALEDPRYRNQALAFTNLGDALVGLEDLKGSVAAYRKAHMLSPKWSQPQLREAEAYVHFDRPNYAQALYETILRQEPANQAALLGLITVVKNTGERDLLKMYIQTFIEKTPGALQKAWAKDELAHFPK
ncbi:MAG: hypothetical protein R8M46_08990 [Ghiorsea sp.]